MASARRVPTPEEKERAIQGVLQIFSCVPYIDRHHVEQLLENENWSEDAVIDELLTIVNDPAQRSVVASVALHHGAITPGVYAYSRNPTELDQIQMQNAGLVLPPHPQPMPSHPMPPQPSPFQVLPAQPLPVPDAIHQLGANEDILQFLLKNTSIAESRQARAEEARRQAYEIQSRAPAPVVPSPVHVPATPAPVAPSQAATDARRLEAQRAEIFLMTQETPSVDIPPLETHPKSPPMPTVAIFFNDQATAAELADAEFIKGTFLTLSVPESQIRVCDVSKDPEIAAWMNEQLRGSGKVFANPLVFIHRFPIGNRRDVEELVANNQHTALLQNPGDRIDAAQPAADDGSLNVGVLGGLLNVGEAVGSGLWSVATAPIALGKWIFGSATPEPEPGIDFLVVHQNWYWRNLHRIFRFTDKSILRLHPSQKDVRAQHDYTSVERVDVVDNHNIRVHYNDGSQEDWIRAPQADIIRMLVLFNERSQGSIRIVRLAA